MNKPVFPHCNTIYTLSWILTVPILIDISTACTLFSFWLVWLLFIVVCFISIIRLWHGFAQKCYKFCWVLISQLLLGAAILGFFQLSFNNVIHTPFSHSVKPDIVEIADPVLMEDSLKDNHENDSLKDSHEKKGINTDHLVTDKKEISDIHNEREKAPDHEGNDGKRKN